jgi:starvation-inducible DNA-binding protein
MRATHDVCDQHNDVATANLIKNAIDETENRAWFLYEIVNRA